MLIVQLDNNRFSGSIPTTFANMQNLTKLSLRNCSLNGSIPDLSRLTSLRYLDLSHNQLTWPLPTNFNTTIRTIDLSNNFVDGEIPENIYQLPNLELLFLQNNSLDGTFSGNYLNHAPFADSDSVFVMDIRDNNITGFTPSAFLQSPNVTLWLFGNPVCSDPSTAQFCGVYNGSSTNITFGNNTVPSLSGCSESTCDTANNQELVYGLFKSGICRCAYPLRIGYRLKSPAFAIFPPYENMFLEYLSVGLNFSQYQIDVSSYNWESGPCITMDLKLFPVNTTPQFTDFEVIHLYDTFSTWNIPANRTFGPYELLSFTIEFPYNVSFNAATEDSGSSGREIAGIVIGIVAFISLVTAALVFLAVRNRYYAGVLRRAVQRHKHIKISGVKEFTFKEIVKAMKKFDSSMEIGKGGYGKVYKGFLSDGSVVAVKHAQEGSLQGVNEFYNEINLLSRLHHRNLVSLLGYCHDEGEQMLVYEFMVNGTLRDHLNPGSEPALDFATRLQIALGSAKGILYLHTEANPPIFHRDIKATNILLDEKLKAKVADFGLSKLVPLSEMEGDGCGHVSTVAKGTPGYLDPEYFLTSKLTDKSDVYSFGVVLLELITGRTPIYEGKNLVREVALANEVGGDVLSMVDKSMGSCPVECVKLLIELGLSCSKDDPDVRPSMAVVVQELQYIWNLLGCAEPFSTKDSISATSLDNVTPYISSDIEASGLAGTVVPR